MSNLYNFYKKILQENLLIEYYKQVLFTEYNNKKSVLMWKYYYYTIMLCSCFTLKYDQMQDLYLLLHQQSSTISTYIKTRILNICSTMHMQYIPGVLVLTRTH